MILVPKNSNYKDILRKYENEHAFTFSGSSILPKEQIERIYASYEYNQKRKNGKNMEIGDREKHAKEIVNRLQSPPPGVKKGRINDFIYSPGGSNTISDTDEKKMMDKASANTRYTVMEINDIVIMEPIGQPDNATYIAQNSDGLEAAIQQFGRGEAIRKEIIYKVNHINDSEISGSNVRLYNNDSNHVLTLLDYAMYCPNELMQALSMNYESCNLKTLTQRILDMDCKFPRKPGERILTGIENAIDAVGEAVKEKNITEAEINNQGNIESEKEDDGHEEL